MELSKYVKSENLEVKRSEISLSDYNPRSITDEAKKTLKRGIKKFGLVGGVIVNKRTNMTIVSGHQRVSVMDELQRYNAQTKENDYVLRVDVIDVDENQEKELNILLNNPNAQGEWDYDKLREIIPDIDYKDAGLTDADLNLIGVDFLLQTEEENSLSGMLDELMSPVQEMKQAMAEAKREETETHTAESSFNTPSPNNIHAEPTQTMEEKVQHMKEVKKEVAERAREQAQNMDAYVMISFDTWQAKAEFCEAFELDPNTKFIKGEVFAEQLGLSDDDNDEEDDEDNND